MAKRKLPQPIDREEYDKLIEQAKKDRDEFWKPRAKRFTPRGLRINQYICAMALGFGGGLRISEMVGYKDRVPKLTKDKIENNMIRLTSAKGGKDRLTLLPGKLLLAAGINRSMFMNMLPLTVSRRSIQDYVEKLGNRVLNKRISIHKFRHGFCSTLADAGRPLHEIQMLAGHSRLDTTGIYLHAKPTKAIEGAGEVF